jgi:hypothetical protein
MSEENKRGVPLNRAGEKEAFFEYMVRTAIVTKWGGN